MEIYSDLNSPASKEFEKLLKNQLSKTKVEEGKIIEGKISKITDKYCFLDIPGIKAEPVVDINELKSLGLGEKIKVGETISVLIETLENKIGDVVVSANKAAKIRGWEKICAAYEAKEQINGKIVSRVKGGCIVEHIETGSLLFLPGSQISDSPMKDISHLMMTPQKFVIIKLDRIRGNACVSRREVISSSKKEDKAKLIKKYSVGMIIKNAECKSINSFGAFLTVNGELDVLCHMMEASYSRINHCDEVFEVGKLYDVVVISVDETKQQVGVSRKKIFPDPFDDIDEYKINSKVEVTVDKITQFGAFCSIKPGLVSLLHNSEVGYQKNATASKSFKVGMKIPCIITSIDKEARRIAISYKATQVNPFDAFKSKYPIGKIAEASVVNKNEYALFVKFPDSEIQMFCHVNDIIYQGNEQEELAKYSKGSKLLVKVLEINSDENKIRVSHRETKPNPYDYFKDKKVNDILTVKVVSSNNKGLIVKPENVDLNFTIKKSQIAANTSDQRASRFTEGDRIDVAIQELNLDTKKVILSIKLLEDIERKIALEKYGASDSGKSLPFSNIGDMLSKEKKKKKD